MTITGQSSLDKDDIDQMVKDAEAHAEEDRRRREEAEVRNQADTLVYQTEKLLREQGDKISRRREGGGRGRARRPQDGARTAPTSRPSRRATEALMTASQSFTQKLYEAGRGRAARRRRRRRRPAPAPPPPTTTTSSTPRSSTTRTQVTDDATPPERARRRATAVAESTPPPTRRRRPRRRGRRAPPTSADADRRRRRAAAEPTPSRPTSSALAGRARRVPRRLPPGAGRLRELPQAHGQGAAGRRPSGAGRAGSSTSLLPVLDACDAAVAHGADRASSRSARRCSTRSRRRASSASTPTGDAVRPRPMHEAVHARAAARATTATVVAEVLRTGYRWKGRVLRPAMVKVTGLEHAHGAAAGVVREGLLQGPRRRRDGHRRRTITSAYRKLAAPVPPRRQPRRHRRRGALQGGLGRLRRASATRTKRKEYDEVRKLGPMGGDVRRPAAPARRPGGGFRLRGRRRPRRPARRPVRPRPAAAAPAAAAAAPGPQRGADLEAELHLVVRRTPSQGVTTTVHLTSDAACSTCHGTGAAPGHHARRRARSCGGRGVIDDNQGFFSLQPAVPALRAAAAASSTTRARPAAAPASSAGPARSRCASRPASPTASASGSRAGAARAATAARPATCTSSSASRPHPLFGRKGDDLTLTVPVTFPEAALGADVAVPTLDGGPVTLTRPGGHPLGPDVPGEGPRRRQAAKRTGDLLVTVEVAVPDQAHRRASARRSRRWPPRPTESPASPPGGELTMDATDSREPTTEPST